jgi:hypothetical protein
MYDPEKSNPDKISRLIAKPVTAKPSPTTTVELNSDQKVTWRWVIENFEVAQQYHGIKVLQGIWHLVDKKKAEQMLEPYKSWLKELLNERRAQNRFKVIE